MSNNYEVNLKKLNNLSIYQLRDVASKVGVRSPTTLRREELRQSIRDVVTGQIPPYNKGKSGRPHKEIIPDEDWDNLVGFNNAYDFCSRTELKALQFHKSCLYARSSTEVYEGYVMQVQQDLIFAVGTPQNICFNKYAIIQEGTPYSELLRPGYVMTATISTYDDENPVPHVLEIKSINGETALDSLPKANEQSQINNVSATPITLQFALPQLSFLNNDFPIKIGQRAMFCGEDKMCGQDYLSNSIAKDLSTNYKVVFLSCNKLPESKMIFNENVEYFFSTFDIQPRDLVFTFDVAFARARLLSKQYNTIFVIDNLTEIMEAHQNMLTNMDKAPTSQQSSEILQQIKIMFASSEVTQTGSLTLFTFASTPQDTMLADYLHQLDEVATCHIALDKDKFLRGDDEFLIREQCRVTNTRRTLA